MTDEPPLLLIVGLLIGAGVGGHALRLVVLPKPDVEGAAEASSSRRAFVAIAAMIFYTISALLVGLGLTAGLVLSAIGPFLGVTAILLLKQKIDRFQKVLGIFQAMPVLLSFYLLVLRFVAWLAT